MPAALRVPAARPVFSEVDRRQICALIDGALTSGSLTLGPLGALFEREFAARHGASHAVAVSSGTAALEIAFRSLGVAGRTVVVPTNTFYATAGAVVHAGGIPRFADIDPATMTLSPATVADVWDDDCVAVALVHIGGAVSPAAPALAAFCKEKGATLIEDAAHAHGASLDDRPAGSFGWAGTFSFYPTKVITSGEGGMIVTEDDGLVERARVYRDQGKGAFLGGDHTELGSAWRMSELHAAVGQVQLRRLDDFISVRRQAAARYTKGLADIPGITPLPVPEGSVGNFYKYVAVLDPAIDRTRLRKQLLEDHGVALSGEVYATPLHLQPVFVGVGHGPLPVAEDLSRRHVCLPVHSDMTDTEVDIVLSALQDVLG